MILKNKGIKIRNTRNVILPLVLTDAVKGALPVGNGISMFAILGSAVTVGEGNNGGAI